MNVLMVGMGAGSWTMRGEQLGAAIGARVVTLPSAADWQWADLAVLVKRAGLQWAATARKADVPIVWDAVDCWSQPLENGLTEAEAGRLVAFQLATIRPVLSIGATEAQARALDGVYLPHHSWVGLTPAPARDRVSVVGYQGNAAYLGTWLGIVSTACAARGWRFVINPPDLREADLLVAFRDGPWDGWLCRQWKSGIKLVNAIAAGRPILRQESAASREIEAPGSIVDTAAELENAFDHWSAVQFRADARDRCLVLAPQHTLEAVAQYYRKMLYEVLTRCAV